MQIELLKPHTHAGVHYTPGAIITMDVDKAQWLIDAGVAKAATGNKSSPTISKLEEKSK